MKNILLAAMTLITAYMTTPSHAQVKSLGEFTDQADVGKVKLSGSAAYDHEKKEYSISGAGTNMWFDRDEFHLLWKRMSGDFIVQAQADFLGSGVDPHRKLGWIVRASLDSNSAYADVAVHGDGLTSLQYRRATGDSTREVKSSLTAPNVIQLERKGNKYIMSVARFGEPFVTDELADLALGDTVYIGLFVCSHNPEVIESAVFRNVRIIIPAKADFVPYRDYIGSNLEILDVETGERKIIHKSPESLQAPNWTPDGKSLIYNSDGLLYRFDLEKGMPEVINTDFATQNNNDHVLSFDGKMLGISHHDQNTDNKSIIYTLPAGGGKPQRITALGPSYLHGWSPDGQFLVYTAERNGDYDIYKIPARGGEEIRLTNSPGLDDGSEYSPDGKHIYFNSVRSGLMQIWRMNPAGGNPQQITDDEFNNWFPHISPSGQWIVFLSYTKDVAPEDHPFYEHVYLRMMPVAGGSPKVVAYLYGGQGSINVPSWSPDSQRVAFVSNSELK
jgi:Tol biopolymer transport system component